MKLSRNFRESEFACSCCGKVNISRKLVRCLQQLRDVVGPITITCGYRCPRHNREVGGVKGSLHIAGMAADCYFHDVSQFEAFLEATRIPDFLDGGIGIYLPYWKCKNKECGHVWESEERTLCPKCGGRAKKKGNFLHLDVRGNGPARWGQRLGVKCGFQEVFDLLRKDKS